MSKREIYLQNGALLGDQVMDGAELNVDTLVEISMQKLRDRDTVWPLIGDLFDGGVKIFSPNTTEVAVIEGLGFEAEHCVKGKFTAEELRLWANNSTWVIDEEDLYDPTQNSTSKGGVIFVCDHGPKVIKPMRILRIRSDNGNVFIYVDNEEDPTYIFNCREEKWQIKLSRSVKKLARKRKKKLTPLIVMPPAKDGVTTIGKESVFYKSLAENRLCGYVPPDNSGDEAILKIILAHTEEQIKFTAAERADLLGKVSCFVQEDKPVEITISLAIGCRIQNRLKYFDDTNLPTLGWVHFAWCFRYINEKIKRIYSPGIKLIVFDEAVLFYEMMNIPEQAVRDNLAVTRTIIENIGSPIEVYEMEKNLFPASEIIFKPNSAKNPQVYAMVCSLIEMEDKEIMQHLYKSRGRDYAKIRQNVGEKLWKKAQRFSDTVVSYLSWRKEIKLFQKLGFDNALDACITDKDGRVVFDITSGLLINHGMPVVRRGKSGLYKFFVLPEYRIHDEFPNAKPVFIDPRQSFGIDEDPYTFYYREE